MTRAHIVTGLGLLLVLSSAIAVETPSSKTEATLRALTADFSEARSMPLGSRPGPSTVDLAALHGLSPSAVRAALGDPDSYENRTLAPDCQAALCWSFTYGPGPAPLQGIVDNGDGTMSVDVQIGGPWLLIIGFKNDRLVTAFWQGQK